VIFGLPQLFRTLGIANVPMEISRVAGTRPDLHGSDQNPTGQIIASHVAHAVHFKHFGFFLDSVPSKGSVNVDLPPNLGGSGTEFDGLYAPHDGFGVRLTDGKGFHGFIVFFI